MSSGQAILRCSEIGCGTGQDVSNTGRKVVSDFFGRNKRETKTIPLAVWHLACRKHYQRGAYAAKSSRESTARCKYYLEQLSHQLTRLALWRPNATFTVKLQRPAKGRLTAYHDHLRRNNGDENSAKLAVAVAPKSNNKGERVPLSNVDGVQMSHAEHIDAHFCGRKAIDYIRTTILPWIKQEVDNGDMTQMPPIEFLINAPTAGETIIDPNTNYDRWVAHCDGAAYTTAGSPSETAPPSKKRAPEIHDPRTPKKQSRSPDATPPARSGFIIKIKNGKATSSRSSGSLSSNTSSGPSQKRKASDSDVSDTRECPSKKAKVTVSPTELTPEEKKRNRESIPYYIPPAPPLPRSSAPSKKRPASLDLSSISNKRNGKTRVIDDNEDPLGTEQAAVAEKPTSSAMRSPVVSDAAELPDSAYTTSEGSPIRARGMIFAAAKPKRVLREPVDDDYDDDEASESEPEIDETPTQTRKISSS